jgi:ABC-type nitrate/sulfonate/bicarbonate transport system substrate-binding protein
MKTWGSVAEAVRRVFALRRGILACTALSWAALHGSNVLAQDVVPPTCNPPFKTTPITVMYQPSGASSYFYANAAHIWQKFGLELKPIKIEAGQSELAALSTGSIDFAFLGGPPTLTAIGRKLPVKVIFSTNDVSHLEGLVVLPSSGIKSLADLAGKTVAVPKGSSAWVGMHLVLAKQGIPIDKVHILDLSPNAIQAAFSNGTVQAAWIWDTWIERLQSLGAKVVALEKPSGVVEPNSWVVSDRFLKENPEAVARFVAALHVGAEGANRNPAVAAPEFSSLTGISSAQATEIMKNEPTFTIDTGLSSDSPLSFVNADSGFAASLARSGAVLQQYGILPNAPTKAEIASAIDAGPLKDAKAMLAGRCNFPASH